MRRAARGQWLMNGSTTRLRLRGRPAGDDAALAAARRRIVAQAPARLSAAAGGC
jgi:hypothetical protein